ncbi:hypothetical protein M427DRAFT_277258 [Gonapodya prolifera JEL478]|uniref:Zn(2)-C6 fungal-type domain-containing protein n=1 Tax=Gonapodya prolifera (strain JEL478) TaxID=1344416 RepID=A0A139AY99_GONPJ|nr:hypothetical protein M427DRAFT_277258 [Gonapodya prolifera JEL478]|eukprot:KXS21721.1 hypothetical protein M427DRAFT_277258 [Gonapodya prolifera JEL478]
MFKACDACHRLKAKCAGNQPCERCKNLGEACTYDRPSRRRGPKVTQELAASKRLKTLEALVRDGDHPGIEQLLANVTHFQGNAQSPYFTSSMSYPYSAPYYPSLPLQATENSMAPHGHDPPPSDEFSAANIIHGFSRSSSSYGVGNEDAVSKWALPPPHVLHHLVITMAARETFPTVSQGKLLRLVADHAQSPPGTRPLAIIPAAAALGAYQLSRIPNATQSDQEPSLNPAGTSAHYLELACQLLNTAMKSIDDEIHGDGLCIVENSFARRGKDPDKFTVLAMFMIGVLCSTSLSTMMDGDFFGAMSIQLGLRLGLNRELPATHGDTWIDREESRRIWWMIL